MFHVARVRMLLVGLLAASSLACGRSRSTDDDRRGETGAERSSTTATDADDRSAARAVVQVATGASHSCVLLSSGGVSCWGSDDNGQLGSGGRESGPRAAAVDALDDATFIAAGSYHTCAVRRSGRVACWGANDFGQLADDTNESRRRPVEINGLEDVVSLAAGVAHCCALRRDGPVRCWGGGYHGQLGDGSREDRDHPVAVAGLSDAVEIAAGADHSCARRRSGEVVCWGAGADGQLGIGRRNDQLRTVTVRGLDDAAAISAGGASSCARRATGSVVCWGRNDTGQLGDGSTESRAEPVAVAGLDGARELAVAEHTTCATRSSGQVVCWGRQLFGPRSRGGPELWLEPEPIEGAENLQSLSGDWTHFCGHRSDGESGDLGAVVCWGRNKRGQLGERRDGRRAALVKSIDGARELAGGSLHHCARLVNDKVSCWGLAGLASRGGIAKGTFFEIDDLENVVEVDASGSRVLVRLGEAKGGAILEGGGERDELQQVNLPPAKLRDIVEVSLGDLHTCARHGTGMVTCWGEMPFGPEHRRLKGRPLVAISGLTDVVEVASGGGHSCARQASGEVFCWGWSSHGQAGDVDDETPEAPRGIAEFEDAEQIVAGRLHSCARRATGEVICWGANGQGQLGRETAGRDTKNEPAPAPGLRDVVEIAAGEHHTCARRSDEVGGDVVCWGAFGRDEADRRGSMAQHVRIEGLSDVVELSAGGRHTCARRANGKVLCWGRTVGGLFDEPSPQDVRGRPPSVVNLLDLRPPVSTGDRR